ncbi:LysR family transcriptional regulator [Paraburkholderia ferrariae]|uniref:LysR family transcriptional regulator n=1 Tax=Paraburkholderia ferrariae TaxID=386056 RepID=UPI0004818A5D|nr:LysR family transcriptional regulator [Paraburkholderia ferrariae]
MNTIDLNLLLVLDVLLTENSVARAARRLGLTPSALSRSLARLRASTGDPLLVRAGRDLVPTPLALELRPKVRALVEEAHCVLVPSTTLDLLSLERTFTIRANDGFLDTFGARVIQRIGEAAPNVKLRFAPKSDKNVAWLRDGLIDLDIGVVGNTAPELRIQALFQDHFIGVVRKDHPLVQCPITPESYAAYRHISVSRRGERAGPIDEALARHEIQRNVSVTVPGFLAALSLAAHSDLIANVPAFQTRRLREGMHSFKLPVATPKLTVSQIWHPRLENDLSHRWLRSCLRSVCSKDEVL